MSRVSLLAVLFVALLANFSCKGADPLVGTWHEAAHSMTITLNPDKTWAMATGPVQDFGGSWVADGNTVKLNVTTLGGKPVDRELADRMVELNKDIDHAIKTGQTNTGIKKMTPAEQATEISDTKKKFSAMTLKVASDGKSLTCSALTPDVVFTKQEKD